MVSARWGWSRLAPLLVWIGAILWVASRPRSFFFPTDARLIFGIPRHLLQHPYHLSVFFILAVLFARCIESLEDATSASRVWALSGIGCLLVAVCSELLQLGVPTRSAAFRDVATDLVGATFGIGLWRSRGGRSGSRSTTAS